MATLSETAQALVAGCKGLLAADESVGTITKRFAAIGITATPENRHAYREMLLTTPGLEHSLGGVILFDETLRELKLNGTPVAPALAARGILPGIKVDRGTVDLAGFPDEKITEGLDGLRARLKEYRELGARFTKWRAVISLGRNRPTAAAIDSNAECLARFAALSQEQDLVPIVEPEVLMDGAHSADLHGEATHRALKSVFRALEYHRVRTDAMLLKTNMVLAGTESDTHLAPEEVAQRSVRVLRETVPATVAGIVFLSGGQGEEEATLNLTAINRIPAPWPLSFSFGRALQDSALKIWKGDAANVAAAQDKLRERARANAAARAGLHANARTG